MSHLSLESLARLVDETPTPGEADHLELCGDCRAELARLREQTLELGGLPPLQPPAGAWSRLEARLRREGILPAATAGAAAGTSAASAGSVFHPARPTPAAGTVHYFRLAAALALFALGGVAGFTARGLGGSGDAGTAVALDDVVHERITNLADAVEAVEAAETRYLATLDAYNRIAGSDGTDDIVTRLATLESIVLATRAALSESPADPIINGYHLAALSQRDAMYRQLSYTGDEWF